MKSPYSRRFAIAPIACVLVIVGSLCWLTWRRTHHALANHNLLLAIARHDPAAIQDALSQGADPNAFQPVGQPAANSAQSIKSLFPNGSQGKTRGPSALALAAPKGMRGEDAAQSVRMITLLLQQGADPDARDERGMTALMWAALTRNQEVVQLLLAHGCQVEAKDNEGRTALCFAANGGSVPIAEALLKKGARINMASKNGSTPLMGAVWSGSCEMVAYLLKNGADTAPEVIVKDDIKARHITALSIARSTPLSLRRRLVPLLQPPDAKKQ